MTADGDRPRKTRGMVGRGRLGCCRFLAGFAHRMGVSILMNTLFDLIFFVIHKNDSILFSLYSYQ